VNQEQIDQLVAKVGLSVDEKNPTKVPGTWIVNGVGLSGSKNHAVMSLRNFQDPELKAVRIHVMCDPDDYPVLKGMSGFTFTSFGGVRYRVPNDAGVFGPAQPRVASKNQAGEAIPEQVIIYAEMEASLCDGVPPTSRQTEPAKFFAKFQPPAAPAAPVAEVAEF
jgi:hypothetical protein